jgi:hypothetical protein
VFFFAIAEVIKVSRTHFLRASIGHHGRIICHPAIKNDSRARGDGKRFVVRADEKLTAFVELEAACAGGKSASQAVAGQGGKCRSTLAGYL